MHAVLLLHQLLIQPVSCFDGIYRWGTAIQSTVTFGTWGKVTSTNDDCSITHAKQPELLGDRVVVATVNGAVYTL